MVCLAPDLFLDLFLFGDVDKGQGGPALRRAGFLDQVPHAIGWLQRGYSSLGGGTGV